MVEVQHLALFSSVIGIVLVLASVVAIPNTVNEYVTKEVTYHWKSETFDLHPDEGDKPFADLDFVWENECIVCIRAQRKGLSPVIMRIATRVGETPLFMMEVDDIRSPIDDRFWTPPYGWGWSFSFENTGNVTETVSVNITVWWPKGKMFESVTYYNHIIDPVFVYPGILAITIGTILAHKKTPTKSNEQIIKKRECSNMFIYLRLKQTLISEIRTSKDQIKHQTKFNIRT